jgi:hypothetical protein
MYFWNRWITPRWWRAPRLDGAGMLRQELNSRDRGRGCGPLPEGQNAHAVTSAMMPLGNCQVKKSLPTLKPYPHTTAAPMATIPQTPTRSEVFWSTNTLLCESR